MTEQTNPAETMAEELPVPLTVEEALLNRTQAMMYWHERVLAAETDFARTLRERDAAREALRELNEATSAIYPSFEAGADAQLAWSDRIDCARQRARAVLEGKS